MPNVRSSLWNPALAPPPTPSQSSKPPPHPPFFEFPAKLKDIKLNKGSSRDSSGQLHLQLSAQSRYTQHTLHTLAYSATLREHKYILSHALGSIILPPFHRVNISHIPAYSNIFKTVTFWTLPKNIQNCDAVTSLW
jgi:hypothetical protein